ncbi:hypothetical protein BU15DRAFT_79085 [Melanogaster broomeanus]|nr:hypothetical protein BU15DRAFT_79085 [Melanogaster broomeanus]
MSHQFFLTPQIPLRAISASFRPTIGLPLDELLSNIDATEDNCVALQQCQSEYNALVNSDIVMQETSQSGALHTDSQTSRRFYHPADVRIQRENDDSEHALGQDSQNNVYTAIESFERCIKHLSLAVALTSSDALNAISKQGEDQCTPTLKPPSTASLFAF